MSYFEFFTKNKSIPTETKTSAEASAQDVVSALKTNQKVKTSRGVRSALSKDSECIKGTCLSMCPDDEVKMREITRIIHALEVIDGKKVLVKCYSRSAADSLLAVPRLLRPFQVLLETVRHLLLKVVQKEDINAAVMYDFVADRLRAVRQDMTVQRLSSKECVTLLEPMIRFHVYFGYRLCEYPIKAYDPVINKKLLLECLKWYLSCCDSMDQEPQDVNIGMSQLNLNSNSTSTKEQIGNGDDTKCDRVLVESLYILCNLNDVHPMYRYWNLPKEFRSCTNIKLAYKIAVSNWRGNFVQVCKQLDKLCPLTYCALCLYLPTLQRHALQVLSAAYNSKQLTVPLSAVRHWLRLESNAEATRVCAYYGLKTKGEAVAFAKGDFKADVATHTPTRLLLLDLKMDLSAKHVFTYTSKDYAHVRRSGLHGH